MEAQSVVALLITIALCDVPSLWRTIIHNRKLRSIPTIGPSGPSTSYIGALRFLFHSQEMVQEGYNKFRGSLFKIPTLTSWILIVSGDRLIDELRRAPDDALSSDEAFRETLSTDLTLGPTILSRLKSSKDPSQGYWRKICRRSRQDYSSL
ncbi:hypothetical protein M378DRAFT_24045 [Amanita muscaria Koide BX008]|uniref:Cytochrome P450 n=1 Tax=Amanita muscaria (strain Koide BX008) TaxID=946122 RepID=A0A0C2WUK9_AMAMK|nr:hypothetical protein M378DRAFT_24045 [Amanita muscaria Koide BX008]